MRDLKEQRKMRNNLFWIVAILAAVPAVCFFVVGICVVDKAPWFMAGFTYLVAVFTFLLWQATKKYAETTEGLLKQSEEAVRQSRLLAEVTREYTGVTKRLLEQSEEAVRQSKIVFRFDLVGKFLEYIDQLRRIKAGADSIATSCRCRLLVLGRVNKPLAEELWEDLKNVGDDLRKAMEKYDGSFREELDKRVNK